MWTEGQPARPRVVVLGGGFAGVGAARKLKDAGVDVVLVDPHDYHTFQPLLYQVASGLLETSAVGHPLRDLLRKQPNVTVRQSTVAGVDLARARCASKTWRRSPTTTSCWRSAPGSTSSAPRAPPSTPSRCTRSSTPCA